MWEDLPTVGDTIPWLLIATVSSGFYKWRKGVEWLECIPCSVFSLEWDVVRFFKLLSMLLPHHNELYFTLEFWANTVPFPLCSTEPGNSFFPVILYLSWCFSEYGEDAIVVLFTDFVNIQKENKTSFKRRSSCLSLLVVAVSVAGHYAQQFITKVWVTSLYASVECKNLDIDLSDLPQHMPPPFLLLAFLVHSFTVQIVNNKLVLDAEDKMVIG